MKDVQHFEFGGGLGDVIQQCYENGYYCHLDKAGIDYARAKIAIVCHNPAARELFDWHPKRALFDIQECGYWLPHQNKEMRAKFNLPARPHLMALPQKPVFYSSPTDAPALAEVAATGLPYVLVAQAAGMSDRNLDVSLTMGIIESLKAKGIVSVITGRTYPRTHHQEPLKDVVGDKIVNLIDKMTIPGTLNLMAGAKGLITCHSALNLAAWHARKPQLLLYPKSVYDRHFVKGDQWSFGRSYRETYHACWDDKAAVTAKIDGFLKEVAP